MSKVDDFNGEKNYRWMSYLVVTFMGKFHSNFSEKKSNTLGDDYETLKLGELFSLEPAFSDKDNAPAIIPSSYFGFDARVHEVQRTHGIFVALTGDIDAGSPTKKQVETAVRRYVGECVAFLIYSSSNASELEKKWRVVIPLEQPCSFQVWQDMQEAFFDCMESDGLVMDRALARAAQPVYLPNVPNAKRGVDGEPNFYEQLTQLGEGLTFEGPNAAFFLAALLERRALDEITAEKVRAAAKAKTQTRKKSGGVSVIDEFNNAYSIDELLIANDYEKGPHNKWRSRYQKSKSHATRNFGDYWVSFSESDVLAGLGGRCESGCFGDAFDLFCHFEHGGDFNLAVRAAASGLGLNKSLSMLDQDPSINLNEIAREQELLAGVNLMNGYACHADTARSQQTLDDAFHPLDLHLLSMTTPQPVAHFIDGWLPKGGVTLLHSHGGVGKSFIANIEAAVCLAAGIEWFGQTTERCRVAVISCEDPVNIIHLRLAAVCNKHRIDILSLKDWLFILDATDLDMVLADMEGGRSGKLKSTRAYERLNQFCQCNSVDVLIVDNASDTFGGDEVIRQQVKTFMRVMLLKLVKSRSGSVLLLSHDSKSGSMGRDGGESYSGNTAWHNSARKRWSLKRKDDGTLSLKDEKSNWGSSGGEILLGWDSSTETFVQAGDAAISPVDALLEARDLKLVLRAIKDAENDFALSLSPNSKGFVHSVLSVSPHLRHRRWLKGEIRRICTKAVHDGLLLNKAEMTNHRNQTERIRLTPAGLDAIAEPELNHEYQ